MPKREHLDTFDFTDEIKNWFRDDGPEEDASLTSLLDKENFKVGLDVIKKIMMPSNDAERPSYSFLYYFQPNNIGTIDYEYMDHFCDHVTERLSSIYGNDRRYHITFDNKLINISEFRVEVCVNYYGTFRKYPGGEEDGIEIQIKFGVIEV